jgi:hypothetical protein
MLKLPLFGLPGKAKDHGKPSLGGKIQNKIVCIILKLIG